MIAHLLRYVGAAVLVTAAAAQDIPPTTSDSGLSVYAEPGTADPLVVDPLAVDSVATDSSGVALWKVGATSAGVGIVGGVVINRLHAGWWADRNPTFRFADDNSYALNADKLGHAYGGMAFTRGAAEAFEAAGVDRDRATVFGAGLAWGLLLVHEVHDGYGPYWGFSRGDLAANTVGVAFEAAQRHVPAMDAASFKLSYWPSGAEERTILEDYRGQTYWLSVVPHDFAPESVGHVLPPLLGLAGGVSVEGSNAYGAPTNRVYTVALDLRVDRLGLRGPVWETVTETLRLWHLPSPGVRLSPRPAFVLAY